jgi:Uma2 family endonuclease
MATATTTTLRADPQVVLSGVSWETYDKLLRDLADCSAPRLTYDRGCLEIMRPTPEHERLKRRFEQIVDVVVQVLALRVDSLGSSTFRREDIARGFEPDSCFYVTNAHRVRGKKRIDLTVDPPPDLVIEIDIASSSIPKAPIFARIGVPEVWRFDGKSLRMWKLEDEDYVAIDRSLSFPILTSAALGDFLAKSQEWEDYPRLARFIRDWVAANR